MHLYLWLNPNLYLSRCKSISRVHENRSCGDAFNASLPASIARHRDSKIQEYIEHIESRSLNTIYMWYIMWLVEHPPPSNPYIHGFSFFFWVHKGRRQFCAIFSGFSLSVLTFLSLFCAFRLRSSARQVCPKIAR